MRNHPSRGSPQCLPFRSDRPPADTAVELSDFSLVCVGCPFAFWATDAKCDRGVPEQSPSRNATGVLSVFERAGRWLRSAENSQRLRKSAGDKPRAFRKLNQAACLKFSFRTCKSLVIAPVISDASQNISGANILPLSPERFAVRARSLSLSRARPQLMWAPCATNHPLCL